MSNLNHQGDKYYFSYVDQSIMDVLKHKSFLEELLFWTIKYEFPQKMVTFLLNMLPDQEYKVSTFFSFFSELWSPFFAFSILNLLDIFLSSVAKRGPTQKAQYFRSESKHFYRAGFLGLPFCMSLGPEKLLGDKQKHNYPNKYIVKNCSKFSKGERCNMLWENV